MIFLKIWLFLLKTFYKNKLNHSLNRPVHKPEPTKNSSSVQKKSLIVLIFSYNSVLLLFLVKRLVATSYFSCRNMNFLHTNKVLERKFSYFKCTANWRIWTSLNALRDTFLLLFHFQNGNLLLTRQVNVLHLYRALMKLNLELVWN